MAIAVLPYPNMDFVPLDVLTADELDQLVANINAINSATIPTNITDLTDNVGLITNTNIGYSTSEKDTGLTWTDGSHIYAKTVHFGTAPNNASKQVAHGISNLDKVIKLDGFAVNTNNQYYALPLMFANSAYNTQVYVDASYIYMINTADRSAYDCYVTLFYTKS